MLLVSKAAWSGIALVLLVTGTSGPRPTPLAAGANLSKEMPAAAYPTDVKNLQQSLRDKGHYRGNVDGIIGLRTRASVREFQKAQNLPVTGQLDSETALKLGIRLERREEIGSRTSKDKPSAGITWANGSGRPSKTPRKAIKTVAAPESGRGDRGKTLQAANGNRPQ